MAKKFQKTIQRIDTAKISELYTSDKSTSLDDLKLKLAGSEKTDELSEIKNKLITKINDNDPLADLKRALFNLNQKEEITEEVIEEIVEEVIEEVIEDVLEDYNNGVSEDIIIEEIINIETVEEIIEEIKNEVVEKITEEIIENTIDEEVIEEIKKEVEEVIEEVINEEIENITPVKYYYVYKDSYNNNILVREVEKRKGEKLTIHIALNNLEYESFNKKTSNPFNIFHNLIIS